MMMSSSSAGYSAASSSSSPLPLELADPTLYRERGYVDGAWLDADDASAAAFVDALAIPRGDMTRDP